MTKTVKQLKEFLEQFNDDEIVTIDADCSYDCGYGIADDVIEAYVVVGEEEFEVI